MEATLSGRTEALRHLLPGWFALVMGWSGLALAWYRAEPLLGEMAGALAWAAGAVALLAFVLLAAASTLRLVHHADAVREDLAHPVRHAFFATLPISALLLATLGVALFGAGAPGVAPLWWIASLGQFGVTGWVLSKWLRGTPAGGAAAAWNWGGVTPGLFIPVVGNVIAPLAGLGLGATGWASAQLGVGLLFWPVVMVLVIVRLSQAGPLPERMLPTWFIFVAPPAVLGSVALQYGAPLPVAWALWGMALFLALWAGSLAGRIAALPFGIAHWAMSFPLAALAVLTLRLASAPGGAWLSVPALAMLALASLVILALSLATLRGLRQGTLLVPETPAAIPLQPAVRAQ